LIFQKKLQKREIIFRKINEIENNCIFAMLKRKMKMDKQSENFKYFIDNHDELLQSYRNKFVVISEKKVLFASDSFDDALNEAIKRGVELGTFIIQECTDGDSAYTQMFHSRVIFA